MSAIYSPKPTEELLQEIHNLKTERDQLRAELEKERERVNLALKAMSDARDDLLERAATNSLGHRLVSMGNGNWFQLCDAIDALSAGEGGES